MEARDFRGIGRAAQEELRRRALFLVERQGLSQGRAAQVVGVHRQTVNTWVKRYRERGEEGVLDGRRVSPRRGKGRLTAEEADKVRGWIAGGTPDQLGLPFALWTGRAVRELIERRFGKRLGLLTARLYPRRWGMTPQLARVGLEAGPLSQWLHAGLTAAGFAAVLLETRHVKAALSAMVVKTDRQDARGIAQLLRMGWYRSVHRKSPPAQEVRALLVGRELLQAKLRDVELSIRGILRGFGLKVGEVSKGRFAARVEELVAGHEMLETVVGAMLKAREGLQAEFMRLHRRMLVIVRGDAVCRRLMTVPGVGALVAVTFKAAVDDPGRFRTAKAVGAHFGLTPKRYQSGETDVTGGDNKGGGARVGPPPPPAGKAGAA